MAKCKGCGADVKYPAKRCPHCGKKIVYPIAGIIAVLCCLAFLFVLKVILLDSTQSANHATETIVPNGPTTSNVVSPTPTPVTAISVSAKDLWTAYTDNKVSADILYKDKLLAVTGTISDIGQDLVTKAPCVSLNTGDSLGIYAIQCFFPKNGDQTELIAALKDGDTITIYGTCEGTPIMQVQLSDCSFPDD